PLRLALAPRIAALRASGMPIHDGFLNECDYRDLLHRADIGLSMHRSSSGLDLAMKVVDLFGAGTPVCAFNYGECVREQVCDGETGFLFHSAAELAEILERLAHHPELLEPMRRN